VRITCHDYYLLVNQRNVIRPTNYITLIADVLLQRNLKNGRKTARVLCGLLTRLFADKTGDGRMLTILGIRFVQTGTIHVVSLLKLGTPGDLVNTVISATDHPQYLRKGQLVRA
jgi:hypothetical protein